MSLLDVLRLFCPKCGSSVHVHAWYLRLFLPDGEVEDVRIWILRVICTNDHCGRTHAVLPEFIHPYHKHEMSTAQTVLLKTQKDGQTAAGGIALPTIPESQSVNPASSSTQCPQWTCQDRETAVHWIKQFRAKLNEIAGRLRRLLADERYDILQEPEYPWEKIIWLINKLAEARNIIISSPLIFSVINRFLTTVANKGNDHTFL